MSVKKEETRSRERRYGMKYAIVRGMLLVGVGNNDSIIIIRRRS